MITLNQYVGPHRNHPAWCPLYEQNATRLLAACCALQAEMEADGVEFPVNPTTGTEVSGNTFGGWRPPECPQGAANSSHKTGEGVDRYDPRGKIDAWCMAHFGCPPAAGCWCWACCCRYGWATTLGPRTSKALATAAPRLNMQPRPNG